MGRIKSTPIKRITHKVMGLHGEEFTKEFDKNKEVVNKFISVKSKKLRNIIAGYTTRIVKKGEQPRRVRSSEDEQEN